MEEVEGVAEGKEEKIAQLKKDHETAVYWSKNEKSPQKREAARQKAEKIKRHLEKQYKQGVAEGFADDFLSMAKNRNPNARIVTAVQKRKETEELMKKRETSGTKPAHAEPTGNPRPLGGYDPKSGRSYSESTEPKKGLTVKTSDDTHDVVNSAGKVVKQFHKTTKGLEYAHQYVKQNKGVKELDEVSQDVLKNYFKKAVADLSKRQIKLNTGLGDSNDVKKMQDRRRALNVASAKLASKMEEVELDEALDAHDQAMTHKTKADKAMDKNDLESYHMHMSAHHESMGQWHESKGRHSSADKEYEKAEKHHELGVKKATQKNEEVELDEATWAGHSDTVKNPNFNDELSIRRVSPPGKRLKSGKLDYNERSSQERLKALMKFKKEKGGLTGPKGKLPEEVELDEKTLTPAELKKREEVAKAMERKNPNMDKSRKMAIATAVAKRVAEQYDDAE